MKTKLLILLLILLSIIMCTSIKTHASNLDYLNAPLIVEQSKTSFIDLDDDNALNYNGYITFDKKGLYNIDYTDINNEKIKRDVIVASKKEMEEGISYTKEVYSLEPNKQISLDSNIIFFNDSNNASYINQMENDKFYAKVSICESNIKSSITLENYTIKDMTILNNLIYLLYSYKNIYNKMGILILDNDLNLIRECRYNTNKEENPISLINMNNELFVLFESTSNIGLVERINSFNVVCLMKINKISLKKDKIIILSNNTSSSYYTHKVICDKLYLVLYFYGDNGEYYNTHNKSYEGRMIISIDSTFKQSIIQSLSNIYDLDRILLGDIGYYIISEDDDLTYIDINYFPYDKTYDSYTLPIKMDDANIYTIIYGCIDNSLFILINNNLTLSKIIKVENNNIINTSYYNIIYKVNMIKQSQNKIYFLSYDDICHVYEYSLFNIKSYKDDNNNFTNYNIYSNNKLLDTTYHIDNTDKTYGLYEKIINIKSKELCLALSTIARVALHTNIRNDEEYDINSVLHFNGIGYLNNTLINDGYIITDIGKYQLDIIGENNEKTTINFIVCDNKEKTLISLKDKTTLDYITEEHNKNLYTNPTYDVSLYKQKDNVYYALILASIISFCFLFYISYKEYKKKGGKI